MTTLVEEMIAKAEKAPEPGLLRLKQIIDSNEDTPQIVSMLESAGYHFIYDTQTAERSICNRNMLPKQLLKGRPDGSRVFTTEKPAFEPKRGSLKCLLHEDNPNREYYNTIGLPVCNKSNLVNPLQVELHMKHRHHVEWDTIERERLDAEKKEERDFQRGLMTQALGNKEAPLYVSEKAKDKRHTKKS